MEDAEYNDSEITTAISRGSREALSYLFTKFYAYLYNYGLKIAPGNEEIIEDTIQEIFLSIWNNREKMSDVRMIKSYLFMAFRKLLFRQMEKKQSRSRREKKYLEDSFSDLLNVEEMIVMYEMENERLERLKERIDKLSKREKEIIYLKFYNGMQNEEISQIMNINIQSVYNLLSKAINSLKLLMKS